jgi:Asp-tRNA(Asn)/Glu-tRNA(Gln) amidotransferase A subunit family amidase
LRLLDRPLAEQAEALAGGEADAAELLDDVLARIEERNGAVNAVVATFPERSREMLDAAPSGPLRGVPVVIKDEWPLPWRAQRFGAAQMLSPTAPGESGPYRALRDAGAVIAGVANMHEWGASSTGNVSVYGPARNPWNTDRCPGGSSSGPGAATAARIVAGAVGADGIGSIRYPAAYCGVTGLKPTFGRSAMEGHHLDGITSTIVSGPLCTDAAGCRLLASALFAEPLPAGPASGLRIGVVRGPVSEDCSDEVRAACERAVEALREETGASVQEVELPGLEIAGLASVLVGSSESLGGISPAQLNGLSEEVTPIQRGLLKYRMLVPASVIARAGRVRSLMRRSLADAFAEVDVIAWPTVPAVAPPLEEPIVELPSGTTTADAVNPRGAGLANLTGNPAVSVPVGFEDGLPIGLQLQGAWGSDALLLDAAEAIERATERRFVDALPPLASSTETPAERAPAQP